MYTFQSSGHFNFTTEMDSSNSLVLNFAFPCGLRGFHVYKELWNPKLNEKLETIHEENNPHDRYAVAAIRKTVSRLRPVVVGHLPREISRFTRFIILHGATVKVKVSETKYRRSPLIQGGLEIPVEVEVQMENSSENEQALSKYQTPVAENYHEPVNGKYVDATPDILKALDCDMNHQVTTHIMRQTINNFFYMFYCHRKSFEYLTLIRKKV